MDTAPPAATPLSSASIRSREAQILPQATRATPTAAAAPALSAGTRRLAFAGRNPFASALRTLARPSPTSYTATLRPVSPVAVNPVVAHASGAPPFPPFEPFAYFAALSDAAGDEPLELLGLLTPNDESKARSRLAALLQCPLTAAALVDPVYNVRLGRSTSRAAESFQPMPCSPAATACLPVQQPASPTGPSLGAGLLEALHVGTPSLPKPVPIVFPRRHTYAVREDFTMREVMQLCIDHDLQPLADLWQALYRALCCPIKLELPQDPHIDADGHTFAGSSIQEALYHNKTCPLSRTALHPDDILPHQTVRGLILWLREVALLSCLQITGERGPR